MQETYLKTAEVAKKLSVSTSTLRTWRMRGFGPTFVKLGKAKSSQVRYPLTALEQWLASSI